MEKKNNPRYPYTYAADLIRSVAGYNSSGTKLSRSDASKIRRLFSDVLGISDDEFAKQLADYYLKNQEDITNKGVTELISRFIK